MKTKDYLMYLIQFTTFLIISIQGSVIFLVRKLPVFFTISVFCALCTILIIYFCIKNIEIRTRDSDFGENKMQSEKHISNMICINTFEDFLKSAIESCILIEKYQGYFVRNLFRAEYDFPSSYNKNEILFLLCLSDNLHNVPELAELFIKTAKMIEDCESEGEISKLIKSTKENFLLKLVTERLQKTIGIIRNKEERNSIGIKDNNHILSWCFELNALSSSCEIFYT